MKASLQSHGAKLLPVSKPAADNRLPVLHETALALIREIQTKENGRKIVFVSGAFNILHPGHLRLLRFAAECGDVLVVGVLEDSRVQIDEVMPEQLRLEMVNAIQWVKYACILRQPPEAFVASLRPSVVVKGKEHEFADNCERAVLEQYGGVILFSSGDATFSSVGLFRRDEVRRSTVQLPRDYPLRHGFEPRDLIPIIDQFSELTVCVLGDTIVDEYVHCDALGMSQEDPTLVVTPIDREIFVGGAGIVAAHVKALGANNVRFVSVVGDDEIGRLAADKLNQYGVQANWIVDGSRPTILKQRFRVDGKTLLRVNHLRQHELSERLRRQMTERMLAQIDGADLLIFSDFNYGALPQSVVDAVCKHCRSENIPMVADSQCSSQMGDVSRFKGMLFISPTEYEARVSMRNTSDGLVVMTEKLRQQAQAKHVFVTLGAEGLLIHAASNRNGRFKTDRLPALNVAPTDTAGAGDCFMASAALSLTAGASVWEAAYLGSVAAACQVSRIGNLPLSASELIGELSDSFALRPGF